MVFFNVKYIKIYVTIYMNNLYKNKYLKYKQKYLNLKYA